MKKLFTIILLSCFLTSFASDDVKNENKGEQENTVWVCTGKGAKKYHSEKCRGVKQCKSEIIKVSEAKAKKMGLTKCKICY